LTQPLQAVEPIETETFESTIWEVSPYNPMQSNGEGGSGFNPFMDPQQGQGQGQGKGQGQQGGPTPWSGDQMTPTGEPSLGDYIQSMLPPGALDDLEQKHPGIKDALNTPPSQGGPANFGDLEKQFPGSVQDIGDAIEKGIESGMDQMSGGGFPGSSGGGYINPYDVGRQKGSGAFPQAGQKPQPGANSPYPTLSKEDQDLIDRIKRARSNDSEGRKQAGKESTKEQGGSVGKINDGDISDAVQKGKKGQSEDNRERGEGEMESTGAGQADRQGSDHSIKIGDEDIQRAKQKLGFRPQSEVGGWLGELRRIIAMSINTEEFWDNTRPSRKYVGQLGATSEREAPVNVALLLDCSGSMDPDPFKRALKVIEETVRTELGAVENFYVIPWSDMSHLFRLKTVQNNRDFYTQIATIWHASKRQYSGGTELAAGYKILSQVDNEIDLIFVFSDFWLGDGHSPAFKKGVRKYSQKTIYVVTRHQIVKRSEAKDLCEISKYDSTWHNRLVIMKV
jgi:hypothetical protein